MARASRKSKKATPKVALVAAIAALGAALVIGSQSKSVPYAVSGGGLIAEVPVGGGFGFEGINYPDVTYPSITYPSIITGQSTGSPIAEQNTPGPNTDYSAYSVAATKGPIQDPNGGFNPGDTLNNLLDQGSQFTKYLGAGNVGLGILKELVVEQAYKPSYEGTKAYIETFPAEKETAASSAGAISSGAVPTALIYDVAALATATGGNQLVKSTAGALFPLVAGYEALQFAGSHQAYSEQLSKTQSPFDAANLAANTVAVPITGFFAAIGAPTGPFDLVITGLAGGAGSLLGWGSGFATQSFKNILTGVPIEGYSAQQLKSDSAVPKGNPAQVYSAQSDGPNIPNSVKATGASSGTVYSKKSIKGNTGKGIGAGGSAQIYYGATPTIGFYGASF